MSTAFVGEIRMFAGNFAPRDWAFCDGQLLDVSGNDALFSLLGTIYGGDGRTTFGLPDLRGRLPMHTGTGPGLTNQSMGSKFGSESVTVMLNQTPSHNHDMRASTTPGTQYNPAGGLLASSPGVRLFRPQPPLGGNNLSPDTIGLSPGGSQSHNNLMPYLCVNFIIALFGVYPSRN